MVDIDPNDSVQNEQFGKTENTDDSSDTKDTKNSQEPDEIPEVDKESTSLEEKKKKDISSKSSSEKKEKKEDSDVTSEGVADKDSEKPDDSVKQTDAVNETVSEESTVSKKDKTVKDKSRPENKKEEEQEKTEYEETGLEEEEEEKETKEKSKDTTEENIDYNSLSVEELVDTFQTIIDEKDIAEVKDEIEVIKSCFYKLINASNEKLKSTFLKDGGNLEDFKPEERVEEKKFKELYEKFKLRKASYNRNIEEEKQDNLKEKYQIIEELKELIKGKESINKTFQEFRDLQERWRMVGLVPQASLKDLWETYHYHVEAFYDYVKINKELRDLDLKKNLESKIELCEKAEELLLEPSVVEAFRVLQELHDQWREIGPVPADQKVEIWERFKSATSKINRKHQDYFVNLKKEQKKNLEAKTVLCEKAEAVASEIPESFKEWEAKSKELIEIQKVWKTIGFAPKKHNTKIYQRFREACDSFFNKKREFFADSKEEQENNLQLKIDLCIQAESLAESKDWKKTTEELINLQAKWKEIGPVPFKQSEKVWKRFRAACDKFFNKKSEYYSGIDDTYENNLVRKNEIIKKIEEFDSSGNAKTILAELKKLQREWSEIGYVPLKNKNEIQEKYRTALNKKFDELKMDENDKAIIKFRSRIENILSKPNADNRIRMERDKYINKIKQLESDIIVWENNIGFFTDSKNADSMITEVKEKIESAKEKIELLKDKISIIDEFD